MTGPDFMQARYVAHIPHDLHFSVEGQLGSNDSARLTLILAQTPAAVDDGALCGLDSGVPAHRRLSCAAM
jgi:hypothetical protein